MGEGAGVVCDVFALVFGADQSWCPVPYRSRREEGREARYTDTSQGRVNLEKTFTCWVLGEATKS